MTRRPEIECPEACGVVPDCAYAKTLAEGIQGSDVDELARSPGEADMFYAQRVGAVGELKICRGKTDDGLCLGGLRMYSLATKTLGTVDPAVEKALIAGQSQIDGD